jgi:hypothetical protein
MIVAALFGRHGKARDRGLLHQLDDGRRNRRCRPSGSPGTTWALDRARSAVERWVSDEIMLSSDATRYQIALLRRAGSVAVCQSGGATIIAWRASSTRPSTTWYKLRPLYSEPLGRCPVHATATAPLRATIASMS